MTISSTSAGSGRSTWARGISTTYAYGNDGRLSAVTYSDTTPGVTMSYDRLGRGSGDLRAQGRGVRRRALEFGGPDGELTRQVVELHYFDRLKDAEISERLGGSVAAIRVLRCRALKELRRLMEADRDTQ